MKTDKHMKNKTSPKSSEATVVVNTTTTLTIGGQTFKMTLEELRALHAKIGKAIGADKPEIKFVPVPEKRPERPFYMPPPFQFTREGPTIRPNEVTCGAQMLAETPLHKRLTGGTLS